MVRIHDPRVKAIHSEHAKKQRLKEEQLLELSLIIMNFYSELHGTGDEVTSGPASGYVGS